MDTVQYPVDFTPVTALLGARLVCRRSDADEFEIAIAQPNVDEVRRGVRIHGGRGDIANVKGQTAGNEHLVVPWKSLCRVKVLIPGGIKPLPQFVPADTLIDKLGQEDDIGADMFQSGAEFLGDRLVVRCPTFQAATVTRFCMGALLQHAPTNLPDFRQQAVTGP